MEYEAGQRVGAARNTNGGKIFLYGWGVYEGDHVPGEEAAVGLGKAIRARGAANPRIRLDDGQIVYGCECWWGPEDQMRRMIADGNLEVVEVSIAQDRQLAIAGEAEFVAAARARYEEELSETFPDAGTLTRAAFVAGAVASLNVIDGGVPPELARDAARQMLEELRTAAVPGDEEKPC
jgi:hypothetical protein